MLEGAILMIWEALRINDVIFDQPIRRRRRLARLATPVGVALWLAAIAVAVVRWAI
jgi:hypothetical protein